MDCLRSGLPLPPAIQNAPILRLGLEVFLEAFFDLATCRGGMGGPIPWTAIQAYCNEWAWTGDFRSDVFYHVRALDNLILEREEKSRASES